MTHDRNYLRMLSDSELMRIAIDSYNETAIVLAERLAALLDVEARLETVTNERDELSARCDVWQQQAIEAQDELNDHSELMRVAIDSYNETSIVLAERLAALLDVEARLETVTNERDELDARCDVWQQEAIEAQDELNDLRKPK